MITQQYWRAAAQLSSLIRFGFLSFWKASVTRSTSKNSLDREISVVVRVGRQFLRTEISRLSLCMFSQRHILAEMAIADTLTIKIYTTHKPGKELAITHS
jgi:hypothetical protein